MAWEDKKFADRTIDRLMDVFTENLDVDDSLLAKCLSKGLITGDDLSRIGATVKDGRNGEAVRDLMLHIKRSSPDYLKIFCGVLDDCKSRFLVPRINEEYHKQLEAKKQPDSSATADVYGIPLKNGNRNLIGDGNWPFEKADKQQLPEDFEKEGPKCLSPEVGKPKGLMILPEDVVDDNLPSKIPIEYWKKQEEISKRRCSFKCQSIKDNYKDLTRALPIKNLLSALYAERVILRNEKEEIEKKLLQEDKVSYLLDHIILRALEVGNNKKYDNLIKVMSSNDDTTAQHLAKKLMQGVQRSEVTAMKN